MGWETAGLGTCRNCGTSGDIETTSSLPRIPSDENGMDALLDDMEWIPKSETDVNRLIMRDSHLGLPSKMLWQSGARYFFGTSLQDGGCWHAAIILGVTQAFKDPIINKAWN